MALSEPVKAFLRKIDGMPHDERIYRGTQLSGTLLDLISLVVSTHETNRILTYSNHISVQVGHSYAANTFSDVQQTLFEAEILQIVRLWDNPELDGINVQTIYWLTKDDKTRNHLNNMATFGMWQEPDYCDAVVSKRKKLWHNIDIVIPAMLNSHLLSGMKNIRDKRLAHWLTHTRAERKAHGSGNIIAPTMYGDERRLLRHTVFAADVLNKLLRGAGFDFKDQQRIARRNAEAFWHGCTVKPLM